MRTDEKMSKICDYLKTLGCSNASEKIRDAVANGLDDPLSVVCIALNDAAVHAKKRSMTNASGFPSSAIRCF